MAKLPSHATRIKDARKICHDAIAHALVITDNPQINRSTRTRAAYKVKAQALDRVLRILNGRE